MQLDTLIPAPYNPRKNLKPSDPEYNRIKRSIQEFGLVEPLVFNERTGHLVGGHQRLKALRDLGHTEAEVSVVDLDDAKEKALNLALNKIGGAWDDARLEDLLGELGGTDLDLSLTGFSELELEAMIAPVTVLDHTPRQQSDQAGPGTAWKAMAGSDRIRFQFGDVEAGLPKDLYDAFVVRVTAAFERGDKQRDEIEAVVRAGIDS